MAATGRYVPPHLRNRPSGGGAPAPSASRDLPPPGPTRHMGHASTPPGRSTPSWSSSSAGAGGATTNGSSDRWSRGNGGRAGPALHVYGDSFAGPFKLLDGDSARVKSFKGASAKGLNNPHSIKQLSKELVPLLNSALAPPPYATLPACGRFAILLFANVDLQINYLYQLQHKPIVDATFDASKPFTPEAKSGAGEPSRGPALGPDRFVDAVVKAYCAWIEREIVNGPIGRRAAEVAAQAKNSTGANESRKLVPTKLLIAAALPPLVEDDTLYRIPEKYVERFKEEDAAKLQQQQQQQQRGGVSTSSRAPWSSRPTPGSSLGDLEARLAKTSISTPPPADSPPLLTVPQLLAHDPPVCTKPVRIAMTRRYNDLMRDFCLKYPDVLEFVDIVDAMLAADAAERKKTGGAAPDVDGEVSRGTWACPVDVTNIHPLWEPTLPLWLEALKPIGLPTDTFALSVDAENTLKAYEEDKARRTANRDVEWGWKDNNGGARIKLRDE